MKEFNECDEQVLSLIINYPDFLNKTIIKDVYLKPKARILFKILKEEYFKYREFIIENLQKHKDFDTAYYAELLTNNIYSTSRKVKFNEFEKYLIDRYKEEMFKKLAKEYKGNVDEFYKRLSEIKNINCNETEYIEAKHMLDTMKSKTQQIKIGFTELDKKLNLCRNDFMVLAGGTGTGKTAFALNLLVNLSKDFQCIYFNQEMSESIIYRRLTSISSNVDIRKLRDFDNLTKEEKQRIDYAINELDERKIILINRVVTTDEIEHTIANTITKRHIVAIIDHMGLISNKGKNLYEKMTEIAKELRKISKNYDCTIIGLCQLSRDGQRGERMPTIQDLRDSGEIEQSARKILLLYNENQTEEQIQHMKIIIGKNDDGDKIIKDFNFDKYKQIFYEV